MAYILQKLKETIVLLLCALCIVTEMTFIFMPLNLKGFTVDTFTACMLKPVLFASENNILCTVGLSQHYFNFSINWDGIY